MLKPTSSYSARSVEHTSKRNYSKMKRILVALTVTASLMASDASAYDPDHLQMLKDTNECINCDLIGADLSGAFLIRADLGGANLGGADLGGADLSEAIFCDTTMPDFSVINTTNCIPQ
jgi:uncharacterized protein YjbI with pentapeptide repeats